VSESITLINAFRVPPEESERFLYRWKDNAHSMTGQPGLIRARLYRCLDTDAELRFINVAEWQHRDALEAATATAAFRGSTQQMPHDPRLHLIPRPALYRVAVDLHLGDTP
jgi:heme-degrading monooxygenase HmoA